MSIGDLGAAPVLLGLLAFLGAGTVKGTLGIGLPLVAVPLLATMLDLPTAVALMVVPVLVSNLMQALQGRKKMATLRRFWPMFVTLIPCTLVAAQFLSIVDLRTGSLVLGAIVVLFSLSQFVRFRARVGRRAEHWLNPVVGAISGLLGGLSNLFGPPIVIYLVALRLEKDDFVTTVGLLFLISSATLYATLAANGVLTPQNALVSLLAALPVMAGVWLGGRIRSRVAQKTFERVLLVVLVAIGLNLIRRGWPI